LQIAAHADYSVRLPKIMELLEHLRRQIGYDDWANREVLAGLRASAHPSVRPRQLLAHILSAERLWLERMRQQPQNLPVWPDFTLDRSQEQIVDLARLWREFLGQLSPAGLLQTVVYKNTKGEPWTSTVEDILTHVLLHSAYHRGQIASLVRAGGEQPAYTDFIHAVRQGFVE
jgi:uncharacterized damage-inducible protein DinB